MSCAWNLSSRLKTIALFPNRYRIDEIYSTPRATGSNINGIMKITQERYQWLDKPILITADDGEPENKMADESEQNDLQNKPMVR